MLNLAHIMFSDSLPHLLNSTRKFIQFVDTAARLCRVHLLLLRRDMLLRSSYVVCIQNIYHSFDSEEELKYGDDDTKSGNVWNDAW